MILSSLALDLRRVAQGYFRGSIQMADRFLEEAQKRKLEAELLNEKPYLKKLLKRVDELKNESDNQRKAEEALMMSTIFQNAAISKN